MPPIGAGRLARQLAGGPVGLLEAILESAPMGILLVDESGGIVLLNREIERQFGYARGELLGQSIERLIPGRLRARHASLRDGFHADPATRAMGTGRDLVGLRKDGRQIPVEVGLSVLELEGRRFVLSTVVDIAARRLAEARFRVAVESSPNGMVMVDRSGTIVLANPEMERLFGYSRAELLGKSIDMLVPDASRTGHPALREGFEREPRSRPMGAGRDLHGRRKDGTLVPVEVGLNPIETADGMLVLASIVDISARKRAEDELRRSNEELERFAYVASHDLQEPLRTIASYVQLLERRYADRLDQDARDFIGFAVSGARRMQALIQDLLALSRVGTRGGELVPIDTGPVVDEVVATLATAIREAGATITTDAMPVVLGDGAQLRQLFANLLGNAIKFRSSAAPAVHIGAQRNGRHWIFSIRDNGIGIDPAHHERIFVIFQRLQTGEAYPGTGIGLAVCKKIVERHGGRIQVDSTPGAGATFVFTLQAVPEAR